MVVGLLRARARSYFSFLSWVASAAFFTKLFLVIPHKFGRMSLHYLSQNIY
jgi:hypothetical protein